MTRSALNGIKKNALVETVEAFAEDPSLAQFTFRVRNRWTGGGGSQSDIDDYFGVCEERNRGEPFRVCSDEPAVLLGSDTAPNAIEFLLHAMASCVTTTLLQLATIRDIPIRDVETRLVGGIDLLGIYGRDELVRSGFKHIDVRMTVSGEADAEDLEALCALAWQRSPVSGIVSRGVPVSITSTVNSIGTGRPAAAAHGTAPV